MTIDEAIIDLKDFIDTYITVHGEEDTIAVSLDNVDVEAFHVAIKALEMQKKLAEFSGMDICKWVEDYDYDEENISEYEFEASVDDFLIDESKEGDETDEE